MKRLKGVRILIVLLLACFAAGCGSSDVTQQMSAEERFELGKAKFEDGEYLEAIKEFEIVKLQYPGSGVADDAQMYLADCYYEREEFLLAAEEYLSVKRNFQASPLVPLSQFKVGMSFFRMSPTSELDQQYTSRAIDEFQSYIDYYPAGDSVAAAELRIRELNERLARKEFDTAELYMKLEYYRSATYYYTVVTEKFHDTPYAEPALWGKIRSLVKRKKYEEARQDIQKFLDRFPDSKYKQDIDGIRSDIQDKVSIEKSPTNGERRSS